MNIRIIAGKKLVDKYSSQPKLPKILYKTSNILVEGDSNFIVFKDDNNIDSIFLGSLIGERFPDDKLMKIVRENSTTKSLILNNPIHECVKKIEGRFILLKFNKDGNFKVSCDLFNQIDLYYQIVNNGVILSSSLDFLPFKNDSIKYNQASLIHTLYIYGFRPPKKDTLYENVSRLGVGEIGEWSGSDFKITEFEPYIYNIKNFSNNDLKRYSEILLDAIEKRSSVNGNIVYLSSGWDSTSILASLVKLHGSKNVRAVIGRMNFSKRFGVCNPFEIKRAQAIADYFGVKLEIVEFDYWKRGPEITEKHQNLMKSQMMTGMAFYQWVDISSYISKTYNGESVFSGEISDGAHNFGFSQYATILNHPVFDFREYSDKMASYIYGPTFLNSLWENKFNDDLVFNFLKERFKDSFFDEPSTNKVELNRQILASSFIRDTRFPFWSLKNNKTLKDFGRELYKNNIEKKYLNNAAKNLSTENLYSWYMNLYNSFHWQGGTVASLDTTANIYGFQMNFPFRDFRIQKFLSEMPESWGRGLELKPTKYPLKWMLENCIDYPVHLQTGPHSYLYDIDSSFDHAAEWIYHSAFSNQYKDKIKKREYRDLLSSEVFNIDYYDKIVDSYLKGDEEKSGLDWGSNLANLVFLTAMDWYK